ncbi:dna replication complex gins [Lynx pardinus]|uniref:DNA replication complex GINS protein SLD5 n=4 Tax=Felinae TaxID=338152 RepID=A0A485NCA7_LYNPA|nr:dna replication complex gins [Lynx pardinus]
MASLLARARSRGIASQGPEGCLRRTPAITRRPLQTFPGRCQTRTHRKAAERSGRGSPPFLRPQGALDAESRIPAPGRDWSAPPERGDVVRGRCSLGIWGSSPRVSSTACYLGVPLCLPGAQVSIQVGEWDIWEIKHSLVLPTGLSVCCELSTAPSAGVHRFLVSENMTEELDPTAQDSDGGSEEVVLTPAELIESLEQAWMNEKFAPELLESKSEIVECVMEQLDHMEENLRRAKKGDLKVSIHRMEMERIRYVLSSYLRCRLMKIEKFFPHILEKEKTAHEGELSSLSPEELVFAKQYMANTETYLKNVALKHMPPNLQMVDLLRSVPKPDLDSYVFLRVKERQENILVEPETDEQRDYVIDLEEGSQHLIRYKTIAPLVASGAVQLI